MAGIAVSGGQATSGCTSRAGSNGGHAMSEPGDVVWADGQAWIRGTTAYGDHKAWWCHPLPVSGEVYRRLSEAKQADDFRWLVKDGKRVVHAEDCPPQVAYEAYRFQISNLTELLAQAEKDLDVAENRCASAMDAQLSRAALTERAAIVAWLEDAKRGDLSGLYLASFIARGDHLRSDNE